MLERVQLDCINCSIEVIRVTRSKIESHSPRVIFYTGYHHLCDGIDYENWTVFIRS